MKTMTYSEYEKEFVSYIKKNHPSINEEYINKAVKDGYVKAQYEEDVRCTELLSKDQVNPRVFAENCYDIYPDYPVAVSK